MSDLRDEDVVFNVVWTGDVFRYLRFFVCSLLDKSGARFRFVANAVSADALALMHEFAHSHDERVVEVLEVSDTKMISHGEALDAVYRVRNDGRLFSLVDADIMARRPFLAEFRGLLAEYHAVTSGTEVWTDDNVVPSGFPGLDGRFVFHQNGFVYGSPHLAIYQRDPLDATRARWGVGFRSNGRGLSEAAGEQIRSMGHRYVAYDTAKIVNILFQADGFSLHHFEHPQVMHIGGMSHYLSPPGRRAKERAGEEPGWARLYGMRPRFEVTKFTAAVLRSLTDRQPPPPVPDGIDPDMEARLQMVRAEMIDLVEAYRSC